MSTDNNIPLLIINEKIENSLELTIDEIIFKICKKCVILQKFCKKYLVFSFPHVFLDFRIFYRFSEESP